MDLLEFLKKKPENFDMYLQNLNKTIEIYNKKEEKSEKNYKTETFLFISLAFVTGTLISKIIFNF
jgi:hypothetical protein